MINELKLIEELSNAPGVSGFEDEVVAVGRRYMEGIADITEDSLRNLYFRRKKNTGDKPVVLLDAHSDEVGFLVQAITPTGLLHILNLGGWVNHTIPAHKVKIRNADGVYVPGVVATKPPHYMSEAERQQPLDIGTMVIDVGATSAQEVEEIFKIRLAAPVVPDVSFEYNEQTEVMLGKAFDCRIGCACVAKVMEEVKDLDLGVDIVGTFSAQEEVGTRGAKVTAQMVQPDIAIVFEGCPADDNFAPEHMIQTGLKRGPMLRHVDRSMITNPRFIRYALDLAREKNIPVQEAVRTGGGTNGAPIHLNSQGVPVIVIGIPVRYIHSHHGYAAMVDYKNSVKFGLEVLQSLNREIIQGF